MSIPPVGTQVHSDPLSQGERSTLELQADKSEHKQAEADDSSSKRRDIRHRRSLSQELKVDGLKPQPEMSQESMTNVAPSSPTRSDAPDVQALVGSMRGFKIKSKPTGIHANTPIQRKSSLEDQLKAKEGIALSKKPD
jgi:hypothetical protein